MVANTVSKLSEPQLQSAFDISPDGRKVVFVGNGNGGQDLYILNLADKHVTCVCNTSDFELQPRFSPNGRKIVFAAGPPDFNSPSHIYSCNLDGSNRKLLTDNPQAYDDYPVSLNPNATEVAFARSSSRRPYSFGGHISTDWDIWTLNATTCKERQITHGDYYMIFSLDSTSMGRSIAYTGYLPDPTMGVIDVDAASKTSTASASPKILNSFAPGYAIFKGGDNKIDIISGPCSDTPFYGWAIDSVNSNGTHLSRLAAIQGLLDSIHCQKSGSYIYYLRGPQTKWQNLELWRFDPADKHTLMIADHALFTDPLSYNK
jgi:hypothetical protein